MIGGFASALLFVSTFNALMDWPQTWWQFWIGVLIAAVGYGAGKYAVREWQDAA